MKKSERKSAADWHVFERQSNICKAFANPIRLFILHQLGKRDRSAADLQKMLGISVPNLSQHLTILKNAGVVVTRREGKRMYCSLSIPEVKQACDLIHDVLKRQIEESRSWVA